MQERDLADLQTGLELLREGRYDEARNLLLTVRERSPRLPDAHLLAAIAARGLGRSTLALREIDQALEIAPDLADLHSNRGAVLCDLERYDEAEAALLEALRRNPKDPNTLGDLGRVFLHQKRPEDALTCLEAVATVHPEDPAVHSDIGVAKVMARRVEEALLAYERALQLAPNDAEIHSNYSRALLMLGRYEEGWKEAEWRFETRMYAQRDQLPFPVWNGEPLERKAVLLISEQCISDTLQMLRFAPALAAKGARVIVSCATELKRLVEAMPCVDSVHTDAFPVFADYCIPMLSLPRVLEAKLEDIPCEPYLKPPVGVEGIKLPQGAPKVGLVWSGKRNRTQSFEGLEPLFQVDGVHFVNLQTGPQAYLARLRGMSDATSSFDDFARTAAIIEQLDFVVAVDSSVAHLAGAMGKETLVLLHRESDWRWGIEGETTPWYPTMKLFRPGDGEEKAEPVAALAQELKRRCGVSTS